MGVLSRVLTRKCTIARLIPTLVLLCVCSLILLAFTPVKTREPLTLLSVQEELDSVKDRSSEGLRDVVDPLVQARVLEDPAMHLVEELQVGDNRGYLGSRPEEPREGMVARHRQLSEEDSTVARALGSASVEARGKHQKLAVKNFCAQHPSLALPPDRPYESWELYKHLLYNDEKKIIFCYIPKIGCSNWKRMFAVLQNLTEPTNPKLRPPESILSGVDNLYQLSPSEREERLRSYFKFVMIRNPLERIVSVYRNKILPPFTFEHRGLFPDKEKYHMLKRFESERLRIWWSSSREQGISPSFDSFLKFLTMIHGKRANEHLQPMLQLCHPCSVDYDVYISFKHLPDDAFGVLDMFDIPHEYYRNIENHPEYTTSDLVELYFGNMSDVERMEKMAALNDQGEISINDSPPSSPPANVIESLLEAYSDELDFYFTLHPEERSVYRHMLGLPFSMQSSL